MAVAVVDWTATGKRWPSDDERVPPPQIRLSGWRKWKFTTRSLADRSVSCGRCQVVHQASCLWEMSLICAMRVMPKLQAWARMLAQQFTCRSFDRGSFPLACSSLSEKLLPLSTPSGGARE